MRTRVLLELGCNHQGELSLAEQMVDDAAALGAWGVKIQMRDVEAIPEEKKRLPRDPATSFGDTYYAHRAALELTDAAITALKARAEALGLVFAASVFDARSARRAVELGIRFIKTPSQLLEDEEVNDFLSRWRQGHPGFTMRSTGMHTTREVLRAVRLWEFNVTMYCRSLYPCRLASLDLGSARVLYAHLAEWERGYSSHDAGGEAIPWMVLLGATLVERHYTLDKGMKGSDHHTVSSDFEEMARIMAEIGEVEGMLTTRNMDALECAEERANRAFYVGRPT